MSRIISRHIFLLAICALSAVPAGYSQGGASSKNEAPTIASVMDQQLTAVERQVVSAAEAMPEDKYSFAPTNGEFKGVRTFAEQVKHVGAANTLFFRTVLGEKTTIEGDVEKGPESSKTKEQIVQYLKDSFALGHKAMASLTADNALTLLENPPNPFLKTRLAVASLACWHAMDHYGQMVEYLRSNGIVPPASRPRSR
jgi:uncharacterized damage-inducible protein DinB